MVDMDFCIEIYLRILRQYVCQRSALVNSEHIAAVIQHFRCDAPDVRKAVHFCHTAIGLPEKRVMPILSANALLTAIRVVSAFRIMTSSDAVKWW